VAAQGQMDFMHDLAIPVPIIVTEILGIPLEDREDFKRWSDGIVTLTPLHCKADYFRNLIQQRRGRPRNDLITDLIAAHEGGEKLTAQELVDFCIVPAAMKPRLTYWEMPFSVFTNTRRHLTD